MNGTDGEADVTSVKTLRVVFGGSEEFPDELFIHICKYMRICDLYYFALCDRHLLMLLFNQSRKSLKAPVTPTDAVKKPTRNMIAEEEPSFAIVQNEIWKPLVLDRFPRFQKSLNIKNWMHVMRRRMSRLGNFEIFVDLNHEEEFIENCSCIYSCPLVAGQLQLSQEITPTCGSCKKTVYQTHDIVSFNSEVEQGHCTILRPPKPSFAVRFNYSRSLE